MNFKQDKKTGFWEQNCQKAQFVASGVDAGILGGWIYSAVVDGFVPKRRFLAINKFISTGSKDIKIYRERPNRSLSSVYSIIREKFLERDRLYREIETKAFTCFG